jgi:hypothetical protein
MKLKDDAAVKLAMGLALLAMAVALIFLIFIPKPTTKGLASKQFNAENAVLKEISEAHKSYLASEKEVQTQTWKGGLEQVGPGALQAINALAAKHKVKLSGFRPERTTQYAGLDLVPFSVTAEGSYLDVLGLVKAIEDPANKLAVDLVQVSSSEANGDQVTATIGLTAYHVMEAPKHV